MIEKIKSVKVLVNVNMFDIAPYKEYPNLLRLVILTML